MNAYIDLSYICHIITLLNIPYYFKRILNVKFHLVEFIVLSVVSILLYFNVFIYSNYIYLNYVFVLILFLILYRGKCIKFCILYLFVYYANLSSCIIFTNDLYLYRGLIFVNDPRGIFYIFIQFINILFIELIILSIKSVKLLKNYRLKISIELNKQLREFSGYIDSGNTLLYEGKPVIFLKEKYMRNLKTKEMIVTGIGVRKCKYLSTYVVINGTKKEVICASSDNKGFNGCDCLININLMEECV